MFDIAVFGAGASGLCAALAAARLGRRVLLVERTSLLGGSNTLSLVGPLMGFTFRGQPIVRGIAQEIVELHQGTIAIDSVLGQGTTFTITLKTTIKGKTLHMF